MKINKRSISVAIALCLSLTNISSLSYANQDTDNSILKDYISNQEPFVVSSDVLNQTSSNKKSFAKESPEQIVIKYLTQLQDLSTFKLITKEDDTLDSQYIIRLQQHINDMPIYGSDVVACVTYDGIIKSISGYIENQDNLKNIDYKLNINEDKVKDIAISKLKIKDDRKEDLKVKLYLYKDKENKYIPTYKVELSSVTNEVHNQTIFIDAQDGNVIDKYEKTKNVIRPTKVKAKGVFGDEKEISLIEANGESGVNDGYYFLDLSRGNYPIQTVDAREKYYFQWSVVDLIQNNTKYFKTSLTQPDGKFVDGHYYVGKAYDFYKSQFNRDGLDSKGIKPSVVVNVCEPGNAFYLNDNGVDLLALGNGDEEYYDAAGSIDIIGHEYTHAIVAYTAGLEYLSQSGAIDEAYGDIFGTLLEFKNKSNANWTIGENFSKNGAFRDLSNPDTDNIEKISVCTKAHTHSRYCDYDYVHENSSIINKLAYLISEGGTHYGVKVTGMGKDKMGQLFYNALTEGLYSHSNFKHLGEVLLSKAKTEQDKQTVLNALTAVGLKKQTLPTENISKIAGQNRYETAVKISQKGWNQSDNVVLINSSAIPDALSATPFAAAKDAPILLTGSKELNQDTEKELIRLKAKNIYVIGGFNSISTNIMSRLNQLGMNAQRISGDNRYITSLEIAKKLENVSEISVVNGETGLADAVSIAAIAGDKNMPVLLVPPSQDTNVINIYTKLNSIKKAYIIGGIGSVSNTVESKLPNVTRIGGDNRNQTNAKVVEYFYTDTNLNNVFVAKDGMSQKDQLIDALSVGVLATKEKSPVLLVGKKLDEKQKSVMKTKKPNALTQVGAGANENAFNELVNIYNY